MGDSRLVYSTDGRTVWSGEKRSPAGARKSGNPSASPPADGIIRVFRERGGRHGKIVTVIRGFGENAQALEDRAKELKRLCGAGGTVKDGAIEIQGDHRERIAERLRSEGCTVRLAGG